MQAFVVGSEVSEQVTPRNTLPAGLFARGVRTAYA